VPTTALNTKVGIINVTAASVVTPAVTDSKLDTAIVTINAVINISKTININSGAAGTTPYVYTLKYTNTGTDGSSVTITDPLPAGVTYNAGSGIWSGSATPLNDLTGANDPAGINYYVSGNTVTAVIASVPGGVTGNVSFSVRINANALAGPKVNTASFTYKDGPGGTGTTVNGTTNSCVLTVLPTPAVSFTGQTVASANQGTVVVFNNTLTNLGNTTDTFNITLDPAFTSTFPPGTTFTLYQADGVTPLQDTNGDNIPDSGPMAPGAVTTIVVHANLPTAAAAGGPYEAKFLATSGVSTAVTASAPDILTTINASLVDVTANDPIGGASPLGVGPGPGATPVVTNTTNPGTSTTFTFYVNNTSSIPDAYALSASATNAFNPVTSFGPGVTVTFYDSAGTVITNTGTIPAGGNKLVHVVVTEPANKLAGTYDGYFKAISPATTSADSIHFAVTVNTIRSITVAPDHTGQVYPGGSIVYTHTVTNNGNVVEGDNAVHSAITLALSNNLPGFSSAVYYDANSNGILDATDPIVADLNTVNAGAGIAPGASITLFVKEYAPPGATAGQIDVATLVVTTTTGTYLVIAPPAVVVKDTTTVVSGDLVVTKYQANDALLNGGGLTPTWVTTNLTAKPGEGIRYKIVARNNGATTINSVFINDAIPAYTAYHDGNGTNTNIDGVAVYTLDGITFTPIVIVPAVGGTGTITANIGTLTPGQTATVYFGVKVNPL